MVSSLSNYLYSTKSGRLQHFWRYAGRTILRDDFLVKHSSRIEEAFSERSVLVNTLLLPDIRLMDMVDASPT